MSINKLVIEHENQYHLGVSPYSYVLVLPTCFSSSAFSRDNDKLALYT
jgi:hypothetical protein